MWRVQIYSVVTPIAVAGKFGDRHQFNGGDTQLCEVGKFWNYRFESSVGSERAGVQLIDDMAGERDSFPGTVRPFERIGIDDLRRTVHALRLKARHGVGTFSFAIQHEGVKVTWAGVGNVGFEVFTGALHDERALGRSVNFHLQ